ncbi:hypothetical protein [Pararhizobium sp. DWP3-4]|uniref:hypothetical protein n=1 Tax=Pararhizobium sp. DWP3-4 TaxID=2804565 RepID=UPI003CE80A13
MTESKSVSKNQVAWKLRRAGPGLGLTNRQNKAVRFLGKLHPEPQPTSVIAGVSDITMEELIARNAVAEVSALNGKERLFVLMVSGEDEVRRLMLLDESYKESHVRS